jgi:hypothetical protein
MKLRFLVSKLNEYGQPLEDHPEIHLLDTGEATLGSWIQTDLRLQGVPEKLLLISIDEQSRFKADCRQLDFGVEVTVNGNVLGDDSIELRNGDVILFDGYRIRFYLTIESGDVKRTGTYLIRTCLAMVAAVVFLELTVMFILPRKLESEKMWGQETRRQRTITLLDFTRKLSQSILKRSQSENQKTVVSLVSYDLDLIAEYLRKNDGTLSHSEMLRIYEIINGYKEKLNILRDRKYFKIREIDIKDPLNDTLKGRS